MKSINKFKRKKKELKIQFKSIKIHNVNKLNKSTTICMFRLNHMHINKLLTTKVNNIQTAF